MEYINGMGKLDECFLCRYFSSPEDDAENLVLCRSEVSLVCLNRYPYSNGHLLIAPGAHKPDLSDLGEGEMVALIRMLSKAQEALKRAVNPHGFNVGMNLGRCAGAGLPGHLHFHIVPRWQGDTNFMTVTGEVRVIPQDLGESYRAITAAFESL